MKLLLNEDVDGLGFCGDEVEVKDGYAPYWGFSKEDLIIGSAGAFLPIAQHYSHPLNAFDVKFSYWKRHNTYWDLEQQRGKTPYKYAWQDDYVNQTYWLSIDIHHFYEKFHQNHKSLLETGIMTL